MICVTLLKPQEVEEILYGRGGDRRYTQDSPVLPDVWVRYGAEPHLRHELLLTPHVRSTPGDLARVLRQRLAREREHPAWRYEESERGPHGDEPDGEEPAEQGTRKPPVVMYNESVVMARLSFRELVRAALPLSHWWLRAVSAGDDLSDLGAVLLDEQRFRSPARRVGGRDASTLDPLLWQLIVITGSIEAARLGRGTGLDETALRGIVAELLAGVEPRPLELWEQGRPPFGLLWNVNLNRAATRALWQSRVATKADAATRLFNLSCSGLCWAVLDTGVDALHPAFWRRDAAGNPVQKCDTPEDEFAHPSRVRRTYDFLRLKPLLDPDQADEELAKQVPRKLKRADLVKHLKQRLQDGKTLDWDLLEQFLRIPHDSTYIVPTDPHGTHVAGIIAADWRASASGEGEPTSDHPLIGMCPDLELIDLRVLGRGADEFTVMAAMQFVRYLNATSTREVMSVHGANVSLSVLHDVTNYACGRTPLCDESERLVGSGVIVVTAAGNRGYQKQWDEAGRAVENYMPISITDPGNAETVITVGATHRSMPHTYGVSYFSSRGPTGDGRAKPDLVAPGEKIDSCAPGEGYATMDGTSQAAPHVSGAAALLLARHTELIGQPARVKKILCATATDLGRERAFQGHGMLDVLRALQSV